MSASRNGNPIVRKITVRCDGLQAWNSDRKQRRDRKTDGTFKETRFRSMNNEREQKWQSDREKNHGQMRWAPGVEFRSEAAPRSQNRWNLQGNAISFDEQ